MTQPALSPVAQAQADLDQLKRNQSLTNPLYKTNAATYNQTYGRGDAPQITTPAASVAQSVWSDKLAETAKYGNVANTGQQGINATVRQQKADADLKRWQDSVVATQKSISDSFADFQRKMATAYPVQHPGSTTVPGQVITSPGAGGNDGGVGGGGVVAGQYLFNDSTDQQIAAWARQAGWSEADIPTVIGIAEAESSRTLTATHLNTTGSYVGSTDYGLMQDNDIHAGETIAGYHVASDFFSSGAWKDPVQNLRLARALHDQAGGWSPWTTFNDGLIKYHPAYTVAKVDQPAIGATPGQSGGGLTSRTTGLRSQITTQGLKYLGTPYVYAGDSLTQGVDCSGLVHSLYQMFGFNLPRTARQDARPTGGDGYSPWGGNVSGTIMGTIQSKAQMDSTLMVGDLLTFKGAYLGPNEFGHVGIYMGNGKMLESPDTGLTVRVRDIRDSEYSSGNIRGIHLNLPGDSGNANKPAPTSTGKPSDSHAAKPA